MHNAPANVVQVMIITSKMALMLIEFDDERKKLLIIIPKYIDSDNIGTINQNAVYLSTNDYFITFCSIT